MAYNKLETQHGLNRNFPFDTLTQRNQRLGRNHTGNFLYPAVQ